MVYGNAGLRINICFNNALYNDEKPAVVEKLRDDPDYLGILLHTKSYKKLLIVTFLCTLFLYISFLLTFSFFLL